MRLGLRFISVRDVNYFNYTDEVILPADSTNTLYMQLVNLESDNSMIRYMPPVGATLQVYFNYIDSKYTINRAATQPFINDDRSIWAVSILATDRIAPDSLIVKLVIGNDTYPVKILSTLRSEVFSGSGKYYA